MTFVVSPSVVINVLTDEPLTHARIGYDNFVPAATVTATSEATPWPADSVQRENTFERWQPTSGNGSITIDNGTAKSADYIGIAAHTLGSAGSTLTIAYSSDNSTYTTIETVSPSDSSAIMVIFAEVTARYFRVSVAGATAPQIGVIYLGMALAMERAIYSGHTPVTLGRMTEKRPTKSESGQFLGSSTIRQGLQTNFTWNNLKADWYREYFDPFVKSARNLPFFIAWRPSKFPNEIGYCWSTNDITPTNSGGLDYMSVSMRVEGYADE
jgi:hypothetical protein